MKKRDYVSISLLTALGILIFAITDFIQWNGDAYSYQFNFANGRPIENMAQVVQSQYHHFFLMNGRIWAHVLCQGFSALWGQTAFAVCNALVYILFVLLFAKISCAAWRNSSQLLLCILVVLFICDVSYITNCQIGYIWTSTVTLAFLILYFRAREAARPAWWVLLMLFVLSLLAGNGNEAIAIGVGASLIVDFFRFFKRLTLTQWVMLVGFGIGGLFLCLSPGILDRASQDSPDAFWSTYRLLIYSRMLYVMVITLAVLKLRHRLHLREFVKDNWFFFTTMVVLLVFNYIIGIGLTNRQLFGVELFAGIITVRALRTTALPKWLLGFCSLIVIALYVLKFDYLTKSNEDLRKIRTALEQSDSLRIFVDFHRYPTLVHPSEQTNSYKEYKYNVWTTYEVMTRFGYIDSLNRLDPPYYKETAVYPTVLKKVLESDDRNFAMKCADGTYLVVQDKRNPKRFFLHRNYNILGIKWPKEPYEIQFDDRAHLNIDGLNILYNDFATPLIENGEITIE